MDEQPEPKASDSAGQEEDASREGLDLLGRHLWMQVLVYFLWCAALCLQLGAMLDQTLVGIVLVVLTVPISLFVVYRIILWIAGDPGPRALWCMAGLAAAPWVLCLGVTLHASLTGRLASGAHPRDTGPEGLLAYHEEWQATRAAPTWSVRGWERVFPGPGPWSLVRVRVNMIGEGDREALGTAAADARGGLMGGAAVYASYPSEEGDFCGLPLIPRLPCLPFSRGTFWLTGRGVNSLVSFDETGQVRVRTPFLALLPLVLAFVPGFLALRLRERGSSYAVRIGWACLLLWVLAFDPLGYWLDW